MRVERDEFQNFRQDINGRFDRLHECDRRIENKIDALAATLAPVIEEHGRRQEKTFEKEVRLLGVGSLFGAAGTLVVYLLTG